MKLSEIQRNSVVKDSFTTGAGGNGQGFLDRSNRGQFYGQHHPAEALAADGEDVKELEAVEKKLLQKPEE